MYSINVQSHFSRKRSFVRKNFIPYLSFSFSRRITAFPPVTRHVLCVNELLAGTRVNNDAPLSRNENSQVLAAAISGASRGEQHKTGINHAKDAERG